MCQSHRVFDKMGVSYDTSRQKREFLHTTESINSRIQLASGNLSITALTSVDVISSGSYFKDAINYYSLLQ